MTYEIIRSDENEAVVECPNCYMRARITSPPGPARAATFKALLEIRGCECPIGSGGTAAVIPGMMVYRRSTGKKYQVADVQPRTQQIRVIDASDGVSEWTDVCHFAKQKEGTGFGEWLERMRNGTAT